MAAVPEGYRALNLSKSLYLSTNGPFYVRRVGEDVTIGMAVEHRHCNSAGAMHGGMMATFADVAMTVGANIVARSSRFLVTLNLSLDYVGAGKDGDWIEAPIHVIRTTKTYIFAQSVAAKADGTPLARVSATLLLRGDPDPAFDGERFFR